MFSECTKPTCTVSECLQDKRQLYPIPKRTELSSLRWILDSNTSAISKNTFLYCEDVQGSDAVES